MKKQILGAFFVTLLVSPCMAFANDLQAQLEAATAQIKSDPTNPDAYTKRIGLYNKLARFPEAAADLQKQCDLTRDADIKELCMMELSEYKKAHGL